MKITIKNKKYPGNYLQENYLKEKNLLEKILYVWHRSMNKYKKNNKNFIMLMNNKYNSKHQKFIINRNKNYLLKIFINCILKIIQINLPNKNPMKMKNKMILKKIKNNQKKRKINKIKKSKKINQKVVKN